MRALRRSSSGRRNRTPEFASPSPCPLSVASPTAFQRCWTWLTQRGETPSGAAFFRYLTIDMERELEVEAGVPVAAPLDLADGAGSPVAAGTLPGGRFVRAFFVGHPDGLENATAELLQWAETQGLRWDMNDSPVGERWGCRLEIYHSDPVEDPDMNTWRTELAFRLADGAIPN